MIKVRESGIVTECTVRVPAHDPLTFFFCRPSFLIGRKFYGPNYPKCSNLRAGPAAFSELRSCVKVEVAVLGFPSLINLRLLWT